MEKRLKNYLQYMGQLAGGDLTQSKRQSAREELLIQIGFFQHERLVHLIVTVTFAILTMLALFAVFLADEPAVFLLLLLFLALLIPYIRHYYILENGVQKLYGYYDLLADEKREDDHGVF